MYAVRLFLDQWNSYAIQYLSLVTIRSGIQYKSICCHTNYCRYELRTYELVCLPVVIWYDKYQFTVITVHPLQCSSNCHKLHWLLFTISFNYVFISFFLWFQCCKTSPLNHFSQMATLRHIQPARSKNSSKCLHSYLHIKIGHRQGEKH